MPTKKPTPLPKPLRYLQSFANALAKLPPEDLNEDVDASRLEASLRKRVRGLDEEAADEELAKDRDLLKHWLADNPDHPAHWIYGFLLSPDLTTHLMRPAEPPPRGPEIFFEPPSGWKMKAVPFQLHLKAGKIMGQITAMDEFGFAHTQYEREQNSKLKHPSQSLTWTIHDVSADESQGKKFVCVTAGPVPWKQVDYVLRVRGGFVDIWLGTMTGVDFDESPLESKLHTLRLSAST